MLRSRRVLYIFTSKCAFRHSGVQFFSIWTSKSGPGSSVFEHFHFRMCFSPQRRAIFRHVNFQKWSEIVVFCSFWLANVLFATAACNFWCHLSAPTSAPAALTGLLLDWPDRRIYEKTQHFVTSLTFGADEFSFFWLSDYCFFCRLTWLLDYCFSALHIVGSFYLNFLRLFSIFLSSSFFCYQYDSLFILSVFFDQYYFWLLELLLLCWLSFFFFFFFLFLFSLFLFLVYYHYHIYIYLYFCYFWSILFLFLF